MKNDNPFMPWNSPLFEDNPFAPHNGFDADNPFKPWNNPLGSVEDLTDAEAKAYGVKKKKKFDNWGNGWEEDYD